jgi:hypothetical protein
MSPNQPANLSRLALNRQHGALNNTARILHQREGDPKVGDSGQNLHKDIDVSDGAAIAARTGADNLGVMKHLLYENIFERHRCMWEAMHTEIGANG